MATTLLWGGEMLWRATTLFSNIRAIHSRVSDLVYACSDFAWYLFPLSHFDESLWFSLCIFCWCHHCVVRDCSLCHSWSQCLDPVSCILLHSSFFILLHSSFFFLLRYSSHYFSIRDVVALLISLYRVGTRWTSSVFLPFRSFVWLISHTIPHVCIHHIHALTHSLTKTISMLSLS